MDTLRFHLRSAVRALVRRPSLTVLAVVTLALGIGANTAIFSVVRGVLLRPFPFAQPERLVVVWETNREWNLPKMYAAPPTFDDWRRQADGFSGMAAFAPATVALGAPSGDGDQGVTEVVGARVSAGLFDLLGVAPERGRSFRAEEDRPGAEPTVLLSHDLWARRYGADPELVGRTIEIDGAAHRVVGVLPAGFVFPPSMALEGTAPAESAALWLPLGYDYQGMSRGAHHLTVVGRLAPGVSREAAEAELQALAGTLATEYPDTNAGWSVAVVPLRQEMVGPIEPALWLLLGAVALVLLIACVNVANLLLAAGAERRGELAVRRALGASGGRLAGQILTESLLLGVAGGLAGVLLARWGLALLVSLAPANVPRLQEVAIDLPVLAFDAGLTLLTAILFGSLPALRLFGDVRGGRGRLVPSGRTATTGRSAGRSTRWWGDTLVVAEVALALVLLVSAGLLVRSFLALRGVDPGFRPAQVLTLRASLPAAAYPERPGRVRAFERLRDEVRALPGVREAGFVLELPLDADRQGTEVAIDGTVVDPAESQVNFTFATAGYFEAMGVPVVEGRAIEGADRADGEPVVVVNRAFARRFLDGASPLGRQVQLGFEDAVSRRVVGVVGDVLHDSLGREAFPAAYVPYAQLAYSRRLALAVRTDGPPRDALPAIVARLRRVEPGLAVSGPSTMGEIVGASVAAPRFLSSLLGVFAAVALTLAAIGVYGVLSYTVRRRTREIGVRVALGAGRGKILGLVLRRGMVPVALGLALGLAASLALHRLVGRFLFHVSPTDPLLYAALSLFLAAVALAACLVPARRATAIDPREALEEG